MVNMIAFKYKTKTQSEPRANEPAADGLLFELELDLVAGCLLVEPRLIEVATGHAHEHGTKVLPR